MKNKVSILYIFLDEEDSKSFIEYLEKTNTLCINIKPKQTKDIEIVDKINITEKKDNTSYVLLNTFIQSLKEYTNNSVLISGYYHYSQVGKGIIQFLPCYLSNYNKGCLMIGRLAASFDCDDDETDKWVKEIFKWLKKNSKKVYRISTNHNICSDFAEPRTIALESASAFYNGTNGHYFTLVKDIFCIAK